MTDPATEWRPLPWLGRKVDWRQEGYASFVGAVLVIPQGITFAWLAGLPPEYGIYCAVVISLLTGLFSGVPIIAGPNTAVSVLIGMTVLPLAGRGSPLYVEMVMMLTFIVGVMQLLIWLCRGALIFRYLRRPVIDGLISGVGVMIMLASLDGWLGISEFDSLFFFEKLSVLMAAGHELINPHAFAIGAVTIGAGFVSTLFWRRYTILVAMAAGYGAGLVSLAGTAQVDSGLELLGTLPLRLLPLSGLQTDREFLLTMVDMIPGAAGIAVLGMAQSLILAQDLNPGGTSRSWHREAFTLSLANLLAPFFSAFAGAGSFNRTVINRELGSRSPVVAILCAAWLVFLIAVFRPVFSIMPMAVIAGVLFVVGAGMVKWSVFLAWRSRKGPFVRFLAVFLTVILMGLPSAILVAFVLSVVMALLQGTPPRVVSGHPGQTAV